MRSPSGSMITPRRNLALLFFKTFSTPCMFFSEGSGATPPKRKSSPVLRYTILSLLPRILWILPLVAPCTLSIQTMQSSLFIKSFILSMFSVLRIRIYFIYREARSIFSTLSGFIGLMTTDSLIILLAVSSSFVVISAPAGPPSEGLNLKPA